MTVAAKTVASILGNRKAMANESKEMEDHPTFTDNDWINSIPESTGKDPRAVFDPNRGRKAAPVSSGSGKYFQLSPVK